MKHTLKIIGAALAAAFLFLSCDQSPIFFSIAQETKPKPPVIEGSPTEIVAYNGSLYVANGYLWERSPDGADWSAAAWLPWDGSSAPSRVEGNNIRSLAVSTDGATLYARAVNDVASSTNTSIWYTTDGTAWTALTNSTDYPMIQKIFAVNGELLVSATKTEDDNALLRRNGANLEVVTDALSSPVAQVAHNGSAWFMATFTSGIYSAATLAGLDGATVILPTDISSGTSTSEVRALFNLNGNLLLIVPGRILSWDGAAFVNRYYNSYYDFTGAWTLVGTKHLLLLGTNYSSGSSYGYMEIVLNASDGLDAGDLTAQVPGASGAVASTVSNQNQYTASLGAKIVNHLYYHEAENTDLIFASTLNNSLWAYRASEWNIEEN